MSSHNSPLSNRENPDLNKTLVSRFGLPAMILGVLGSLVSIGQGVNSVIQYLQGKIDQQHLLYWLAFSILLLFFTFQIIYLAKLEKLLTSIKLPKSGYQDKYEKLKEKYKDVHFKDVRSTNEFNVAESKTVKIGLMKGVQHSVYAIQRIEKYLPLPIDSQDDSIYFQANKDALERIRINHPSPSDAREFTIHRIFVIAKEAFEEDEIRDKTKRIIKEHCDEARFDVKVVFKEDLEEQPAYEFAVYDDEVSLRLSINQQSEKYSDGVVYFDDAVWRDIYKERYKEIETQSYTPKEFWEKFDPTHVRD
jgi:hypothetical protein